MKVEPIRKSTAANKVLESLYEMITSERLRPGERLPSQDELARQFGVSRNTLREAIHKLSAMGLLKARQGIGTTVEPVSPASYLSTLEGHLLLDPMSVREFIEARISLERTVVRLAVTRGSRRDLKSLRSIVARQKKAFRENDLKEFTRQDVAFHMDLARVSGNRVLVKVLHAVWGMLNAFISEVSQLPGAVEDAIRFHSEIVSAVAAKKADQAEEKMLHHLLDVVSRIEKNLGVDLEAQALFGLDGNPPKKSLLRRIKVRRSRME
jgi:GntR family transcriptional repressor for pyruvate dehydrogenase complex